MLRNLLLIVLALTTVSTLTGCAQLMGALRRDLDDSAYDDKPTTGGLWAERGFLAEDYPEGGDASRYVGHSERNPASGSYGRSAYGNSWVTPERAEANRRDSGRWESEDGEEQVSADNMPVVEPNVRRQYKNGARATRADFVDESQNEGSLWASDGQTNYYFTKNKVRGVGDILTINVEQDLVRDMGLEARRSLSEKEREYELLAAHERLKAKANGQDPDGKKQDAVASSASAPNRAPAGAAGAKEEKKEAVEVREPTLADIDVSKSMEIKAGDPMLGEIIERYPNGNYKIRATKKVPYKGGAPRLMTLIGVVKGSDISEEDTVSSGKLYEYRITASR